MLHPTLPSDQLPDDSELKKQPNAAMLLSQIKEQHRSKVKQDKS